jgi:predicted HTH transcriptional regulator
MSARGETYDEQPMLDLDSEALDFRAASESFKPTRTLRNRDLESLRLLTTYQGYTVPTVGGVLLFGRDRERHFPDAWIQAGRFDGLDKSQILDRAEFRGLPVGAIDDAIAFIEKHSLYSAEIGRVRRTDRWNLPPVAVREAVINAVAHADYAQRGAPIRISIFDDRLEIETRGCSRSASRLQTYSTAYPSCGTESSAASLTHSVSSNSGAAAFSE